MNQPQKNNDDIQLLPPGCEANFAISPTFPKDWDRPSSFLDNVWQLPPTSSSPHRLSFTRINWSFELPDGSTIDHFENASLLRMMKCAVWAMLSPVTTNSNGSSAGAMARFQQVRRFVRWLNKEHFTRLSDLTQADLDRYAVYIQSCDLARGTMALYIGCLRVVAGFRDLIPDNFRFDPYGGITPHKVIDFKPRRDLPIPQPLSDALVAGLYPLAWRWVDQYADAIIAAVKMSKGLSFHEWHKKVVPTLELRAKDGSIFRPAGTTTRGDLEPLAKKLIASCYALIAGFSGARFHEIAFASKTSVPECTISEDGSWEVWSWNSKTFKVEGTLHGRLRSWVIGGRPVGDKTPIWSVVAVQKLAELHSAFGSPISDIFFRPHSLTAIDNVDISAWLRLLVDEELPDLRGEKIRTHQFRRTFARWCVRFEEAGDSAIIQQFSHTHLNWLLGYVGRNPDLDAMFGLERAQQVSEALNDMMTQPIAGPAADEILKERAELLATMKSEKDFVEMITALAKRKDVKLVPSEWGICYYSKENAQCGGNTSGPNLENRHAGVCATCKNLRILPQHRSYHERRASASEQLLKTYPKAARELKAEWNKRRDQSRAFIAQLEAQSKNGINS